MTTSTSKSTYKNFSRRFEKYLRHAYQLSTEQAEGVLGQIMADAYDGDDVIVTR